MNTQQAFSDLNQKLRTIYDDAEAKNIANWVMESITGKRRQEWVLSDIGALDEQQLVKLETYALELLEYRPVQYVLGESYFYNLKLFVDENVLIPRPETEELVHWAINSIADPKQNRKIIDIGTGSGCIALALKMELPSANILAMDVSAQALAVAQKNATLLNLDIEFEEMDILDGERHEGLPSFDIIISNPPYITLPEKERILPNVLQYEPHQALFVTDEDPLQFYKAIEHFAAKKLKSNGSVFLELHKDFAVATELYYKEKGWFTELRKDMQDNDRMLRCSKINFSQKP